MERVPMRSYGVKRRADCGFRDTIAAKTAAYTIPGSSNVNAAGSLSGTAFSNRGAAGSVTFTLPTAPVAGERYTFLKVVSNQNIVISSGASLLFKTIEGGAGSGNTLTNSTTQHGSLTIMFDGTAWMVLNLFGTWAVTTV